MFRSKSPDSKELKGRQADAQLRKGDSNNQEPIPIDISKVESICYKKCIYSLSAPSLSYAEKNCLDRCAYKYKEAIDYGHNLLLYINFKVRDTNE